MRVKTWVEVEQEVEVEVSIAEMFSAIAALTGDDRPPFILNAVNTCYAVLRGVPAEAIAAMNDKQRGIIRAALLDQADRYDLPQVSAPEARAEGTSRAVRDVDCAEGKS